MKKLESGFGILAAATASLLVYSCSSTPSQPLSTSNAVPAAQGTVHVRNDANQNTKVDIEVNHLAPADRLQGNATTYVVWLLPAGAHGEPQNLGSLAIDKNLNGKLTILTPFTAFDLFVTAEESATPLRPNQEKILWTQVNERKTG